jgi:iron(III) transport system substrate-binding protein
LAATAAVFMAGPALAQALPDYYPAGYPDVVSAAKQEGSVLVYGNLALSVWGPLLDAFKAKYPGIEPQVLDLSSEVFARYYAETATGGRSPDLIVAGGEEDWYQLFDRGLLMPYDSPELGHLTDWSTPYPGLYTLASDPAVIVYNKFLVAEADAPRSLADIAAMAKADPSLAGRIATQNVTNSFARTSHWTWFDHNPDGLSLLEELGTVTRPEATNGIIIDKIATGEYSIAWMISGAVAFDFLRGDATRQSVVGWNFIEDGTPIVMRRAGIPSTSVNVNAAKLLLDFLVSYEGQATLGQTGATPYRPDLDPADVSNLTYSLMAERVGGEERLARDVYEASRMQERLDFLDKWRSIFIKAN